jgi:tRNA A-37 threonylcarbamoyl transferase component Bud32
LRLTVADAVTGEPADPLFAKLLARSHLRSDRFYKLFRTLRYGRLEDENKFATVRRLVQQEDYLALRMAAAGIKVPRSLGVIEITPEREYMVVTEFLDGFVEVGDADQVSVALIDHALAVVRRMWDAGLAHRDVKPSNIMVCGDEVAMIDVAFGQMRPSPWRQAVDLANMMLVLALQADAELVYERARLQFSEDEIAEAFAASQGITLPSQVRQQIKRDGRDLVEIFRAMGPSRPRIKIQRWSWRRIGLTAWVAFVAVVLVVFTLTFASALGLVP